MLFGRFGSAIPRVRYHDTRINQGSGGGQCNVPHVGIADPRDSGLIPFGK
jgi:hypothetical protein